MRVLHAADFGGVAPGGFVPLLAALARRVTARGDDFALVVPQVAGATWHPLVRAAGAELHTVRGAREAVRFARAWRPDVAHVHFFPWHVPLTLGLWSTRARIFWHAHSTSLRRGRVRASAKSMTKYRLIGARAERIVTVSSAVADELAALGAPRARIVAIPNAVDSARFRPPTADERAAARAALALAPDERAVLFFGRDPHLKGADVLAAALPQLARTAGARSERIAMVAVATPADARGALARHARVVAIEAAPDVVPLMWACDALAMPSRGEGFGLVLLEAALAGLPVAASDLPALREAAAGHANVRFAAAGDADALACALREALAMPHALRDASASSSAPAPRSAEPNALDDWAERVDALYR
ncbi:MAG TPA: glycosyltransferase family 4 protein [Dongiaceae bacterium]|nr:glycosyltransferase family 4 protein [Dongiaceae bacterium]